MSTFWFDLLFAHRRRVTLQSVNYRRRSVSKSSSYRQFVIVIMRTILWPRVNYQAKMWLRPSTINTADFANWGVIAGCHITSIVACIEYPCNPESRGAAWSSCSPIFHNISAKLRWFRDDWIVIVVIDLPLLRVADYLSRISFIIILRITIHMYYSIK